MPPLPPQLSPLALAAALMLRNQEAILTLTAGSEPLAQPYPGTDIEARKAHRPAIGASAPISGGGLRPHGCEVNAFAAFRLHTPNFDSLGPERMLTAGAELLMTPYATRAAHDTLRYPSRPGLLGSRGVLGRHSLGDALGRGPHHLSGASLQAGMPECVAPSEQGSKQRLGAWPHVSDGMPHPHDGEVNAVQASQLHAPSFAGPAQGFGGNLGLSAQPLGSCGELKTAGMFNAFAAFRLHTPKFDGLCQGSGGSPRQRPVAGDALLAAKAGHKSTMELGLFGVLPGGAVERASMRAAAAPLPPLPPLLPLKYAISATGSQATLNAGRGQSKHDLERPGHSVRHVPPCRIPS